MSEDIKKNEDFLSQVPNWEGDYKNNDEKIINFEKKDWKGAPAEFSDHQLKIFGFEVMDDWETPYMEVLAEIACTKGGTILELGYGMGISAKFIQQHPIKKHIIIEANKEVADLARKFASESKIETIVLEGFWEEKINEVSDDSVDGILFDTYPLEERELYQNHFNFFPYAFAKLKPGGIFTYYSDEVAGLSDVHIKTLEKSGFKRENMHGRVVSVKPPSDCEYWKTDTIFAPIVTK
jgi:guanidinoacetate N-methyltransferase